MYVAFSWRGEKEGSSVIKNKYEYLGYFGVYTKETYRLIAMDMADIKKEKSRERSRNYYYKNKERVLQQKKLYWRNPESGIRKTHAHHKERKRIARMQLGNKCAKCGNMSGRIDFDHIDPTTKEFELGNAQYKSDKDVADEIAKCQLLCASCHASKSNN